MIQRQKTASALLLITIVGLLATCDRPATPTPSPARTPVAIPTALVLSTPMPSPTPTVPPAVRIEEARQALDDGEYETAIAVLEQVWAGGNEADRRAGLLTLARAYWLSRRYADVTALLASFDLSSLPAARREEAWGLLARSYDLLGQWPEAISAYERFLEYNDAVAYTVRLRLAKAYEALGLVEQSIEQLRAIDLAGLDSSQQAEVLQELAAAYAAQEEYEAALAVYDQILSLARLPHYRATIMQLKGKTLVQAGRTDEGMALFRQILQEYPQTWGAYEALRAMDAASAAQVSDLLRGQILYHAGQYEASMEALKRYQRKNPLGKLSTAGYYLGLAYQAQGDTAQAIREFDAVIRRFPGSEVIGEVWMAKARCIEASGEEASPVYREFARRYPSHPRAAEALWRAASGCERQGNWQEAAQHYRTLRLEYPKDSGANEAFFREALAAYVLGDYARARDLWSQQLRATTSAQDRTRTLTWIGLAAAGTGDLAAAQARWREAAALAPQSYYGLRARDLLQGAVVLLPSGAPAAAIVGMSLSEQDWQEIADWVGSWAQDGPPAASSVEEHPLVRRGKALWMLGWHAEATESYRAFRDGIRDDPWALLALAEHCHRHRVHSMVIACAEHVLRLGREAGANAAPNALLRLAYPTSYGHLISAEAEAHDVDVLLFLALVRQESRFNPHVFSRAGAVGLAQVMPATGAWIAERIGPEDFQEALLMRPALNIRYGVWYLSWVLGRYGRNWMVALAAYNAGPTNVAKWTGGRPVTDADLFYELIPFAETRTYLARVYEDYRMYQEVYG